MKHYLFKTTISFYAILLGMATAHAERLLVGDGTSGIQETLAAWDFSNDVKYTQTSADGNKTYYTASAAEKQNMEYSFSTQQPFFYPTSGTATQSTLTILSSDASKKWYISNYNNGALRFYTAAPKMITNPTDASQHYNFAEVELSAAGHKNLQFSCSFSGTNSRTLDVYVLVSTDGGTTWKACSTQNFTGGGWSNFNGSKAALAVDGKENVKIRALLGYDPKATSDIYLNNVKVTAEPLDGATVCTLTTSASPVEAGYVAMTPVGDAACSGTEVSFAARTMQGYKMKEWQDGSGNKLSSSATYKTTISRNTAVTAVMEHVDTYTLTIKKTGEGAKWGDVTLSPEPIDGKYDDGTEVTVTVVPNMVTNFLAWEDGTGDLSRTITVNGNTELTASFDVIPFVVAWDFNSDKNDARGNRAADYAFSTENLGLMYFYQGPNQNSTNWGGGKVTFGGKSLWAARRYTDWTKDEQIPRAFVAAFNVKDFDKIKIHSLVGANTACVRKSQLMQYSTTSEKEGFTTIKTLTLTENPSNDWQNFDCELDTKAIDGMVYIRWIEDEKSDFFDGGSHSGTEGFYLADVLISAEESTASDVDAPQLVSISPAEGSSTASARGNFVLTFNERVKAGTGSVTLNGTTLTGGFGSKSVTYPYNGLTYGETYTLHIGENAITDMAGNAFPARNVTFTVMKRPAPAAKTFDAVVALDGSGDYTSVQEAINNAPANRTAPWLIFIKNGTYVELIDIPTSRPFLHLIGQDRDKTIIKYNINNQGATQDKWYNPEAWKHSTNNPEATDVYGKQGLIHLMADDLYIENITAYNSWGYDQKTGPMALAFATHGNREAFHNVKALSYQDTWYTDVSSSANRQYINNSRIEGCTDYFYGAGEVWVENTTFCNLSSGAHVTAPSHKADTQYGYVFDHCTVEGAANCDLGRPWQNQPVSVFLNCTMTGIKPEGWSTWNIAPKLFAEYGTVNADGDPVDLNNRRTSYPITSSGETVTRQAVLTAEEAARYTYEAVTAGTDDWNPRKFFEPVDAPANLKYSAADRTLTWTPSEYAICYVIIDSNDKATGFTTDNSFTTDGTSDSYTVKAVNEYGSLSQPATVSTTTGIGEECIIDGEVTAIYNLQGIRLQAPAKGPNIVCMRTANGKMITRKLVNN